MANRDDLLECDIVMAGGVTSGIIYPGAVEAISRRYTFRSIGGTSVGAMAAAATAAAEYGRRMRTNASSFDYISNLSETLADTGAGGHSRLFHLFTPEPSTKALLALVTPLFGGGGLLKQAGRIFRATMSAWQIATSTIVALVGSLWMLATLILGGQFAPAAFGLAAATTLVLVVWAIATINTLRRLWLPAWRDNGYGICTGGTSFGPAPDPELQPFEGLSAWMHSVVQAAAGKPSDHPLTFGDLWGAWSPGSPREDDPSAPRAIELSMIASDISRNRTIQLPFFEMPSPIYVDTRVLRRYLPPHIVEWMTKHQGKYDDRVERLDGVVRLPMPHDLPVVFAARLSLSFPVLLSAFPLMTPDFAAGKTSDGHIPLRRLWLSDGGLTSNFPIHFFDSPIPTRPTFCLNLIDYDASAAEGSSNGDDAEQNEAPVVAGERSAVDKPIERARSPQRQASARPAIIATGDPGPKDPLWGFVSTADGNRLPPLQFTAFDTPGAGLSSFFKALLNTARFWSDNQMLIAPGIRDRVVNIALRDDEGGLNLDMPAKTIAELNRRGKAAGLLISARYDPKRELDPETDLTNKEIFANHRWVRFRNFMAAFEDVSRRFALSRRASDAAAELRGEPKLDEMISGDSTFKLGYPAPASAKDYYLDIAHRFEMLAISMADATRLNSHATFDTPRTFGPNGVSNPVGAAPRPKTRFRLRPLVDNDPSSEQAEFPRQVPAC